MGTSLLRPCSCGHGSHGPAPVCTPKTTTDSRVKRRESHSTPPYGRTTVQHDDEPCHQQQCDGSARLSCCSHEFDTFPQHNNMTCSTNSTLPMARTTFSSEAKAFQSIPPNAKSRIFNLPAVRTTFSAETNGNTHTSTYFAPSSFVIGQGPGGDRSCTGGSRCYVV